MTRVRSVCAQPTVTGVRCRRRGCWCVGADKAFYCWQHGADLARNRGVAELTHWLSGEQRTVQPRRETLVDRRPLPTGVDAVVRELDQVRTRRGLARARMAVIRDLEHCAAPGGLNERVSVALAAAKTRVGQSIYTGVTHP